MYIERKKGKESTPVKKTSLFSYLTLISFLYQTQ